MCHLDAVTALVDVSCPTRRPPLRPVPLLEPLSTVRWRHIDQRPPYLLVVGGKDLLEQVADEVGVVAVLILGVLAASEQPLSPTSSYVWRYGRRLKK